MWSGVLKCTARQWVSVQVQGLLQPYVLNRHRHGVQRNKTESEKTGLLSSWDLTGAQIHRSTPQVKKKSLMSLQKRPNSSPEASPWTQSAPLRLCSQSWYLNQESEPTNIPMEESQSEAGRGVTAELTLGATGTHENWEEALGTSMKNLLGLVQLCSYTDSLSDLIQSHVFTFHLYSNCFLLLISILYSLSNAKLKM